MKKPSRSQLRGAALEQRIETVIRKLAEESKSTGKEFVYNATKVAGLVPTTRKTLRAHDALVERVLADLASRRRMVDGNATIEHLQDQITRLKEQIAERDKTILALRSHHVDIYERLHSNSIEAAHLISPIIQAEANGATHCILCGGERPEAPHKSNVVPLKERT